MSRRYFHPSPVRGGGGEQYFGVGFVVKAPPKVASRHVFLVGQRALMGSLGTFRIDSGKGIRYVANSCANDEDRMPILEVNDPSRAAMSLTNRMPSRRRRSVVSWRRETRTAVVHRVVTCNSSPRSALFFWQTAGSSGCILWSTRDSAHSAQDNCVLVDCLRP